VLELGLCGRTLYWPLTILCRPRLIWKNCLIRREPKLTHCQPGELRERTMSQLLMSQQSDHELPQEPVGLHELLGSQYDSDNGSSFGGEEEVLLGQRSASGSSSSTTTQAAHPTNAEDIHRFAAGATGTAAGDDSDDELLRRAELIQEEARKKLPSLTQIERNALQSLTSSRTPPRDLAGDDSDDEVLRHHTKTPPATPPTSNKTPPHAKATTTRPSPPRGQATTTRPSPPCETTPPAEGTPHRRSPKRRTCENVGNVPPKRSCTARGRGRGRGGTISMRRTRCRMNTVESSPRNPNETMQAVAQPPVQPPLQSVDMPEDEVCCYTCAKTPCEWIEYGIPMLQQVQEKFNTETAKSAGHCIAKSNGDEVPNNKVRFMCYRYFIYEKYGHLGKGNRMKLPDCVEKKIKEEFPSLDGTYTNFRADRNSDDDLD
jgi:hypothetical protein